MNCWPTPGAQCKIQDSCAADLCICAHPKVLKIGAWCEIPPSEERRKGREQGDWCVRLKKGEQHPCHSRTRGPTYTWWESCWKSESTGWGFPAGSVVKNPAANAGDVSLIPDPRRSQMLQSNYWACALEPESLNPWAHLLKPVIPRVQASQQEKPPQWEASAPKLESSLLSNEDPVQPKLHK